MAASVSANTVVRAFDVNDNQLGGDVCFTFSGTGAANGCQDTYGFLDSAIDYTAFGSADYGVVKVSGASEVTGTPSGTQSGDMHYLTTVGSALFRDQWTITGMPNGTSGTLQLSFNITGSYDFSDVNSGLQSGFSMFVFGSGGVSPSPSFPIIGSSGMLDYTATFTTPFTYGTPLDFQIALTGGSVLYFLENGGYTGQSSFFDLSNTAVMNAIIVKDAGGDIVPFTLNTESGSTLFNELAPSPVPVPAAAWLFGSGLLGLVGLGRTRRR